MDFREKLAAHLKKYPFIANEMFNGEKTAYGMFLFQEREFLIHHPNVIHDFLNVRSFISHYEKTPEPDLVDFVVIWGVSSVDQNTLHLFDYASRYEKPIVIVEDGFIRSFYPMSYGEISASMRFDAEGCYYDSQHPSAIENLLNSSFELTDKERNEVRKLIDSLVQFNITKYNLSKIYDHTHFQTSAYESTVLVIDQVYGDMSIQVGGITDADFDNILVAAMEENPNSLLLIKQHPEAVLGIRKGHFDNSLLEGNNIKIITEDINPLSMMKHVDKVYCATTQMGLEALLCGKEVHCFGKPFYAGWGLTHDRQIISRRSRTRTLEDIFFAGYIYNTVYLNPKNNRRCSIDEVIEYFKAKKNDEFFFIKLQNNYLGLKVKRLEQKILDIDPLKDTSIKFDEEIKKLNNGFFVRLENKISREKKKILNLLSSSRLFLGK